MKAKRKGKNVFNEDAEVKLKTVEAIMAQVI